MNEKMVHPLEGKKVRFVANAKDKKNADGMCGHLEIVGETQIRTGVYDAFVKRLLDVVCASVGAIVILPLYLLICVGIKCCDRGPVHFSQKRIGRNKRYFYLYKFRTMKVSTPHDVPTHMLKNPEQYITPVGKLLRKFSLDELPQIWNVLRGDMSFIGPRPALWNQEVLIAERDKYGANDVRPGLTGWAQTNGRDALELHQKAMLDGEYVHREGLLMDLRCLCKTFHSVVCREGVIEGENQSKAYSAKVSDEERIGHIGFSKKVQVDRSQRKRVLITGAGSYLGESFQKYARKRYAANFDIEVLDMEKESWREASFSSYEVVFHVAGLAHADVGNVCDAAKERYYKINTELAVETAAKAKAEGVGLFVFMSSMIVYGESAPYGKRKVITEKTVPAPANFYGDSKFQADVALRQMADETFRVIVLRPPMIYGRGSKGNFPILATMAKRLLVFPDVSNQRSMLYIENFCELLCQVMLIRDFSPAAVVLLPQNERWMETTEVAVQLAKAMHKPLRKAPWLAPAVRVAGKIPGRISRLVHKAFGSNCYERKLSQYQGLDYQRIGVEESIRRTAAVPK